MRALLSCGTNKTDALRIERIIKKQKGRALIEKLLDADFVPTGGVPQHAPGRAFLPLLPAIFLVVPVLKVPKGFVASAL